MKLTYETRGMVEDGAVAALEEICRFPLFTPTMTAAEFFRRSWVIRLPQEVPEACRGIVVNLVLDALDTYLNSLPDSPMPDGKHRVLRNLCVIDEAHRILGSKLPALGSLIRMSRSKGGAVMLISQSPDDFQGEDDDFLSEMGMIGAFGTNAKTGSVTRVFGKGVSLAKLPTGQCVAKIRGEEMPRRVIAWEK